MAAGYGVGSFAGRCNQATAISWKVTQSREEAASGVTDMSAGVGLYAPSWLMVAFSGIVVPHLPQLCAVPISTDGDHDASLSRLFGIGPGGINWREQFKKSLCHNDLR